MSQEHKGVGTWKGLTDQGRKDKKRKEHPCHGRERHSAGLLVALASRDSAQTQK